MAISLGSNIQFETSERSTQYNWVKKILQEQGYLLAEFEGYTILENKVSLLLDRARFNGESKVWELPDLINKLVGYYSSDIFSTKQKFSIRLSAPWFFICYELDPPHIVVLDLNPNNPVIIKVFNNFKVFSDWLSDFRSLVMKSAYQESGLPEFDKILRKMGHPWPGNLDCLLGHPQSKKIAIVEFQNTSKYSVLKHCNNDWFLPTESRKGDEQRWKVLDIIRIQAKFPLIIVVWSRKEKNIKVKVVKEVIYSDDARDREPGLVYSYKKVLNMERFLKVLYKSFIH